MYYGIYIQGVEDVDVDVNVNVDFGHWVGFWLAGLGILFYLIVLYCIVSYYITHTVK